MVGSMFMLAAAMVLTGLNLVVTKLLAQTLPVPVFLFVRCGLACLVLAPFAGRLPGWAVLRNLGLQASIGTVGYNLSMMAALQRTGALQAGLVLSTLPAVVALAAAWLLRERPAPRAWAAAALAAGSIATLALGRGGSSRSDLVGESLVFFAVCTEAIYVLLARRNAGRIGPLAATFWMQAISMVCLAPLALPDIAQCAALLRPGVALLMLICTAAVIGCLVLWYAGMRQVPAHLAGIFTILLPTTTAVLAVLVLGESFTAMLAAGFTLALLSIMLATWPRRQGH